MPGSVYFYLFSSGILPLKYNLLKPVTEGLSQKRCFTMVLVRNHCLQLVFEIQHGYYTEKEEITLQTVLQGGLICMLYTMFISFFSSCFTPV